MLGAYMGLASQTKTDGRYERFLYCYTSLEIRPIADLISDIVLYFDTAPTKNEIIFAVTKPYTGVGQVFSLPLLPTNFRGWYVCNLKDHYLNGHQWYSFLSGPRFIYFNYLMFNNEWRRKISQMDWLIGDDKIYLQPCPYQSTLFINKSHNISDILITHINWEKVPITKPVIISSFGKTVFELATVRDKIAARIISGSDTYDLGWGWIYKMFNDITISSNLAVKQKILSKI